MQAKSESQQLALDTIARKKTRGIPTWLIHIMETDLIDEVAGEPAGTYLRQPHETYLKMQRNIGVNILDQYLAENPLSMTRRGYDSGTSRGATTGAEKIVRDGLEIDSPEAVVEHLERFEFPRLKESIRSLEPEDIRVQAIIKGDQARQDKLGPTILKTGYGLVALPSLRYTQYGYVDYFSAYALYPEIMERDFALQADRAVLMNQAAARAVVEGDLPRLCRLDHDMADSRGTLVRTDTLEKIWFPHFRRAIKPVADIPDMNLIWHCDGNLMSMVPGLLECGVKGFQGFQYETGMDYEKICAMKTRDGDSLIIIAGVSVTEALPKGTPDDVRRQMRWLVDNGPKTGLILGGSSSIAPGTNRENVLTFIEGLKYYRQHGRM